MSGEVLGDRLAGCRSSWVLIAATTPLGRFPSDVAPQEGVAKFHALFRCLRTKSVYVVLDVFVLAVTLFSDVAM
ncbi:hypothetical protein [Arthrobacter sp. UYCu723]